MTYIQYRIETNAEAEKEILIALLSNWGVEGFEEIENLLVASGKTGELDQDSIADYLLENAFRYEKAEVKNENWNAIWESSFQPVVVDDFVAVRADFHEPMAGVAYEIIITPKMSFGTGHHATTYLMMQQMRQLPFANATVFDFGTGTGILAILAEKLGAAAVEAVDYDDWCVENGLENLDRNSSSRIKLYKADRPTSAIPVDIMLANINKNIILDNLEQLTAQTKPGGWLLLSGLLEADEADIIHELAAYPFKLQQVLKKNGWIAISFQHAAS